MSCNIGNSLRDVFECIDEDEDGHLSQTDFKVAWKRFLSLNVSQEELNLLWFVMASKRGEN